MFALLPDLDDVLITFLKDHAALAPLHGGRVGHDLAGGVEPALRVTSLGGPQTHPWMAEDEYQVEAWGGDEGQAITLARTVVAAITDLRGPVAGGSVSSAHVTLRPLDSPGTDGRPRRIVQVGITAHPT